MFDHLWTYIALLFVGSNFGFMWGCFFKHESQAISSVILYMSISTLGAGQYINLGTANAVVKTISATSPMRYAVERFFRRILKGQMYEPLLLNMFGFTYGDKESLHMLIFMAILFFFLGWLALINQTRKL